MAAGENPRPADYGKPGPALRARYLHGYRGGVPPMAPIASFAQTGVRRLRDHQRADLAVPSGPGGNSGGPGTR
jgi:hypothetical protein